ncbi:putative membrane protein [Synechococcus sp. BIOS-U3-1]|nr:putative membrane protein [Synechococcus sp. BIOS-U3-1]
MLPSFHATHVMGMLPLQLVLSSVLLGICFFIQNSVIPTRDLANT